MRYIIIFLALSIVSINYSQNISINQNSGVNVVTIYNGLNKIVQVPLTYPGNNNYSTSEFPQEPGGDSEGTIERDNTNPFNWVLKFTAGNKVFKDISFYNTQVGYIVTELGAVYRSTNGGDNWVSVMNLGFPYYWYGVHALSADTVVIAGFNNQGAITTGVVRWSFNGGTTWTSDIILRRPTSGVGWLDRVHFYNQNTGIVFNGLSGSCYYTTTGGKDTTAWTYININSDGGWFAGNIDFQNTGNVYATGIHLAKSTNFGLNWTSGPPADGTFDGGIDFLDNNNLFGWTGGGQISSPVSGWTHRTTDGGSSWGARQNTFAYPIRGVYFYNQNTGFAIGGNVYSESGGIHSTTNGGTNWNLEVNTVAEMYSLDYKAISTDSMDVWCCGSTGGSTGFTGKVYKARMQNIVGINLISSEIPKTFKLYQNYPNPFNPSTKIKFSMPLLSNGLQPIVQIKVYDILGKEVASLIPPLWGGQEGSQPGLYELTFDGKNLTSGIYFYRMAAGDYVEAKRMVLIK